MQEFIFFSILLLEVIDIEIINDMFNEIIDELTLNILETKKVFKEN